MIDESERPGGTCALAGCQAKKWFYEVAETRAKVSHLMGMGFTTPATAVWADILREKNRFTSAKPEATVENLKKAGIDYTKAHARFVDQNTILADDAPVSADHFILATGASPVSLPFPGASSMITSDAFLELSSLPQDMVFVGGGFISFEFAHFARYIQGENRKITILEAQQMPLGPFDREMAEILVKATRKAGIEVQTNVRIESVEKKGEKYQINLSGNQVIHTDMVVHGAGRAPNIDTLDPEAGGIEFTKKGIQVNNRMQTTNPRVYAVGDCAATIQLARVADHEAHVAAASILGRKEDAASLTMDYSATPSMLFTCPQYAMVGKREEDLVEEGVKFKKSFSSHMQWPTYTRAGLKDTGYKVLADENGMILGAHIISDNAGGLVSMFRLAMVNRISVQALYRQTIMTPYPTRESDVIYMLRPML